MDSLKANPTRSPEAKSPIEVPWIKKESNAPEMYQDVIQTCGAPNKRVTDNVQTMTGTKWTGINRSSCIESGLTIPEHQHQNYAELKGGNFKIANIKLFHETTQVPLSFWCHDTEYLVEVRQHFLGIHQTGAQD